MLFPDSVQVPKSPHLIHNPSIVPKKTVGKDSLKMNPEISNSVPMVMIVLKNKFQNDLTESPDISLLHPLQQH